VTPPKKKRRAKIWPPSCAACGRALAPDEACPSCLLYNAAVAAQHAAAKQIANDHVPPAKDAWLNEHGVFGWVGGVCKQIGTKQMAAPFVALTGQARRVIAFQVKPG
jgi:hypothetical protein